MLVYLDSGDLANLERLSAQEPAPFERFLAEWDARGCVLALSLHHAQEIAQLADENSRVRRLSLLERFPGARYEAGGSHKVVTFEAMIQVLAKASHSVPDYAGAVGPVLFQETGLEGLKVTVLEYGNLLRAMESAQGIAAAARNSTRGTRLPHSYRKQTRERMNLPAARTAMEQALSTVGLTEQVRGMMRATFDALSTSMEHSANLRSAFEKAYCVEGYDCIRTVDDDDLPRVATFFSVAKDAIRELAPALGLPIDRCLELVPSLDPYDCPGTRIEMSVSRAQDASGQVAEVADEPDRAHVTFLPYVDVLFADRRTVGFFQQEAQNGKRPEALKHHAAKLHKSGPATTIIRSIDAIRRNAA